MKISLLATCLTETFLPRHLIAIVRLLEHFGHTVLFPPAQTCCGQPMYNNGYLDEARALARRVLDIFEDAEQIVLPSASCTAMIRKHYPELFDEGSREHRRSLALAAKTHEFIELLAKVLKVDLRAAGARWPGRVTMHTSCHTRELDPSRPFTPDSAHRLLEQIEGVEWTVPDKAEQCCGFGGTFSASAPALSGALVADKVAAIRATGAATVVCGEAGCTLNMAGACHRQGLDLRFLSPAELLAESLGLLSRETDR